MALYVLLNHEWEKNRSLTTMLLFRRAACRIEAADLGGEAQVRPAKADMQGILCWAQGGINFGHIVHALMSTP
jgi:hypothetical protein